MADVGKATPLNVLTPVPRWLRFWRTLVLPFLFFLARFSSSPKGLQRLAFIHFARWVLIRRDRFPQLAPEQPPEDLHYDYWLFCSNFNGTWGQYLDAFSDVIPDRVNLLWRGCVKYPKAKPLTPFLKYAAYNEIDTGYYYNAYPGASTRDVLAALELHARLRNFAAATVDRSPEEFQREYYAFLTRVQGCLGTTGIPQRGKTPDDRTKAEPPEPALESHRSAPDHLVAPNGADGNRK